MAGSINLNEPRGYYYGAMTALRNLWGSSYVQIEGKTYKDFSEALSEKEDGNQGDYNEYIKDKADIVFFVIDHGVGDKTVLEYELAVSAFKEKGRPEIVVFCNKNSSDETDVKKLKEKVSDLKQYWVDYKDNYVLEYLFKDYVNRFLIEKKEELGFLNSEVKSLLSIKCQEVVNALVGYLTTIDALCVEVALLKKAWNKYCREYTYALAAMGKEQAADDLCSAVEHYGDEITRISKDFDVNQLKFSSDTLLMVGRYIQEAQELPYCAKNYLTILNEAYQIAQAIVAALKSKQVLNRAMIEAQLDGFQYMCNADVYTVAGVIAQFPTSYHENFHQSSRYWQTLPNGVSLYLKQEDYQRFASREFDQYQRLLDRLSSNIDIQDAELQELKERLDTLANNQIMQPYQPSPIDVSAVVLPDGVEELVEKQVRASHDLWVDSCLKQGWHLDREYSEKKKTNPYLLAFEKLPEEVKANYREQCRANLKMIYALGYTLNTQTGNKKE